LLAIDAARCVRQAAFAGKPAPTVACADHKAGVSGRFDGLFFDWKKVLVYLFKE
jgi:hypothetical protein